VVVGPPPRWFVAVAVAEVGRREGGIPGSPAGELVEEGILAGQLVEEGILAGQLVGEGSSLEGWEKENNLKSFSTLPFPVSCL